MNYTRDYESEIDIPRYVTFYEWINDYMRDTPNI